MFHKGLTPYKIETARTIIRCWNPDDAGKMQDAINISIDSLLPWMPWAKNEPRDFSTKAAAIQQFRDNFDSGKDFVYGIFTRDGSEVIGGCGLDPGVGDHSVEIGCWINIKFQNQGYSTETTKSLIKAAFELCDIDRVQISFHVRNRQSLRVAEKVGFKIENNLLHGETNADDEFHDSIVAILSRNDYRESDIKNEPVNFYDQAGFEFSVSIQHRQA